MNINQIAEDYVESILNGNTSSVIGDILILNKIQIMAVTAIIVLLLAQDHGTQAALTFVNRLDSAAR